MLKDFLNQSSKRRINKGIYIGELPPPYGGVSIKNTILYENAFKGAGVEMIDLQKCRRSPLSAPFILFKLLCGMIGAQKVIIGTGAIWRDKLLLVVQRLLTGKRGLKKVAKIVMGGRYHEIVKNDSVLYRLLSQTGSIWVESESMVRAFSDMGITQTYFFPNCRVDEGTWEPRPCSDGILKLVYFSRICIAKGVDDIISAYNMLGALQGKVTLDFYGELEDDIRVRFLQFIQINDNVKYHGVFDAIKEDVYSELNQYDVMLLPTRWKGEGVPGALVESKMAGITAVVSDNGFNSETVHDGLEGIVLSEPFAENLKEVLIDLTHDRSKVEILKQGAYESRKRYCMETYRETLIQQILG